jgi:hypothetical protein
MYMLKNLTVINKKFWALRSLAGAGGRGARAAGPLGATVRWYQLVIVLIYVDSP